MDAIKQFAFGVITSILLAGCGGSDSSGDNNEKSTTEIPKPKSQLEAVIAMQSTVKDIQKTWPIGVTVVDSTKLKFSGNPELKKGDIFIVQGTAYKAEAVGGTPTNTEVTVSEPKLDEVFTKMEISGEVEINASNFHLEPEIEQMQKSAITVQSGNVTKWTKTIGKNIDGFSTVNVSGQKSILSGVTMKGGLTVGGRWRSENWDPRTGSGTAELDIFLTPEFLLALEKDKNYGASNGVCSTNNSTLGAARYRLGTFDIPTKIPSVIVHIPICVSVSTKVSGTIELVNVTGKFSSTIKLGGLRTPIVTDDNSLEMNLPSTNSLVPDGEVISTGDTGDVAFLRKKVSVEGTLALEGSVELEALKILRLGAMIVGGVNGKVTGSTAVLAVGTNFSSALLKPEVCLTVEGKVFSKPRIFGSVGWSENKSLVKDGESVEKDIFKKEYGICQCPDGTKLHDDGSCSTANFWAGSYRITECNAPEFDCNNSLHHNSVFTSKGNIAFRTNSTEALNFRRDATLGGRSTVEGCYPESVIIKDDTKSFTQKIVLSSFSDGVHDTTYEYGSMNYTIASRTAKLIKGEFSASFDYGTINNAHNVGVVKGTWEVTPNAMFPKCILPKEKNSYYCSNNPQLSCSYLPLGAPARPNEWLP